MVEGRSSGCSKITLGFRARKRVVRRRKAVLELGGGVTAKNTLTRHGLANAVDAFRQFFVVAIDVACQFGLQRSDGAADFPKQMQDVVLRLYSSVPLAKYEHKL